MKVDQGFLMALMELFASGDVSAARQVALFEADCALAETSLCDDAAQSSANEQKHFYDLLHFSPLKVGRCSAVFLFVCLFENCLFVVYSALHVAEQLLIRLH